MSKKEGKSSSQFFEGEEKEKDFTCSGQEGEKIPSMQSQRE
jgi:hypothetical protein